MFLKGYAAALAAAAMLIVSPVLSYGAELPIRLVAESETVDGKVNDPVSKKTTKACIFHENPSFRIEAAASAPDNVDIIVYSNEYVEGEDKGIRSRIVKKSVKLNESFSLLPDELYEDAEADRSLYDFLNRCFVLRIYDSSDSDSFTDHYIGIVEDNIFSEMQERQQAKIAAEQQKRAMLGPAAR